MRQPYYITTPIYYANAKVQFGNMYTALIADVYARTKRLLGYDVFFGTGTDENGQKMVQVAEAQGKDVMTFLDEIVEMDKQVMEVCQISYDDFIRTTESRHHRLVQYILQQSYEKGDIYQGEYEGLYCIGCEGFKKESDLVNGLCPDHLKAPERIQEKNRFFRLSAYQQRLEQFFADHPTFLTPQYRYNEVLSFVSQGLEDFSISRQGSTFGVPIPFDPSSVTYIWYDALLNYLTMMVESRTDDGKPVFRPHAVAMHHTLGKDISRFHAIYRVAMLMSAGLDQYLPRQQYIGGFFTVDGQKMSKSLGNMMYADELSQQTDRDAVMLYMLYDIAQGADGDFSTTRFGQLYETMLIGGRGNFVNRVITMSAKQQLTQATNNPRTRAILSDLIKKENLTHNPLWRMMESGRDSGRWDAQMARSEYQVIVKSRYELVQIGNKLMDTLTPWIHLKNPDTAEYAREDLSFLVWYVSKLALISAPFLINSRSKCQQMLGNPELSAISTTQSYDRIAEVFAHSSFEIMLQPVIMYQKKEKSE